MTTGRINQVTTLLVAARREGPNVHVCFTTLTHPVHQLTTAKENKSVAALVAPLSILYVNFLGLWMLSQGALSMAVTRTLLSFVRPWVFQSFVISLICCTSWNTSSVLQTLDRSQHRQTRLEWGAGKSKKERPWGLSLLPPTAAAHKSIHRCIFSQKESVQTFHLPWQNEIVKVAFFIYTSPSCPFSLSFSPLPITLFS